MKWQQFAVLALPESSLLLVDNQEKIIAEQHADESHELFQILGKARTYYWDIYQEKVPIPKGLNVEKFEI